MLKTQIERIRFIMASSYYYLLLVFLAAVFALRLGLVSASFLNFGMLALMVGIFGFALDRNQTPSIAFPRVLLYPALALSILFRVIPYLNNSVPLGYDPGLYKYLFEHPFGDAYLTSLYPMLFTVVMSALNKILGYDVLLVPVFIGLSVSTCVVIYHSANRLLHPQAGTIAAVLFSASSIQYLVFQQNFYKNVLGINLLLLALMLFKESDGPNWKLVLLGGIIAGTHRPAFLILGSTYLTYVVLDVKDFRTREFGFLVINGIAVIGLALLFNLDRIEPFLLAGVANVTRSVASTGSAGGAFIGFDTYIIQSLPMIPFAITGAFHYRKESRPLAIAALITLTIVILQLYFHNRFIVYLDIFVILFASMGFHVLLNDRKTYTYGLGITVALLVMSLGLTADRAFGAKPLISDRELTEIAEISTRVERDATIMVTDNYYAPWVRGWVDRHVIAPGLFGFDAMTSADWENFWEGIDRELYLREIDRPLYIHVGQRQRQLEFDDLCYERHDLGTSELYEYVCP
jgi:hypothetical protein